MKRRLQLRNRDYGIRAGNKDSKLIIITKGKFRKYGFWCSKSMMKRSKSKTTFTYKDTDKFILRREILLGIKENNNFRYGHYELDGLPPFNTMDINKVKKVKLKENKYAYFYLYDELKLTAREFEEALSDILVKPPYEVIPK